MTTVFERPADLIGKDGTQLGVTDWLTITQERINLFADATGDHQWIHVDPVKAASGPYGKCIAHGYLTLSLVNLFLPELMRVDNTSMGVNYGVDKVRFPGGGAGGLAHPRSRRDRDRGGSEGRGAGDRAHHGRDRGRRAPGLRGRHHLAFLPRLRLCNRGAASAAGKMWAATSVGRVSIREGVGAAEPAALMHPAMLLSA